MTDLEMITDGLLRLGGIGLVTVGVNFGTATFLGFDFLGQLPEPAVMFTAAGALVGAVDSGMWYLTEENLL